MDKSIMEKNIFNFPTSVLSDVNFQTNPSRFGSNNNQQRLHWRSKLIPGLERTLIACQCGCGRTYDELGNWSTALQEQPPDLSSIFHCSTGCRSIAQQPGGTTQNCTGASNHKPLGLGNMPGEGAYYQPQQPVPANRRNIESLDRVPSKTRYHCQNTCNNNSNPSNGECKGELSADHVAYVQKLQEVMNVINCENCNQLEVGQKFRGFVAFQNDEVSNQRGVNRSGKPGVANVRIFAANAQILQSDGL